MALLGTHRTYVTGVSPGVNPAASLIRSGTGAQKLKLDLGAQVIEVALAANPRAEIEAIRDDLDRILDLKEAA